MINKDTRDLIITATIGLALFLTIALYTSQATVTASRSLETEDTALDYGIDLEQTTIPPYFVKSGDQLTYTLNVTNTYGLDFLHLTITDTLPTGVTTNAQSAGTILLPGGKLVWTPTITSSETWTQQVVVTVEVAYTGPLTNVVEVTSLEGPYATSTHTNIAALDISQVYLPLATKNHPKTGELLINPGFEGIGVPVDNTLPNYDNWTRDTFDGVGYGEIFTPEGWVTWWEEGEYGRPECKVIPNEYPFNFYPKRIYQGYYSGMCFTFFRPQHAGYYQRVKNLRPGAVVEGWYYAHAWSCDEDAPPLSCGDPEAFSFRVGIDPNGGTDPFSNNILWSTEQYIYDVYDRVGPIQAVIGENGTVTFFLRSYGKWPNRHNDAYWDNPTLVYVEP